MTVEEKLREIPNDLLKMFFNVAEQSRILKDVEVNELIKYPYWFVKVELPELMENFKLTELIKRVLKFNNYDIEVNEIDLSEQVAFIVYCVNMYNSIVQLEQQQFQVQQTPEAIAAGVDVFDKYGEHNAIDALANGDALKWPEAKLMPYEDAFTKLLKNKEEAKFNEKLNEIMRKKNKQ